jgi:hypothetical protein
MMQSDCPDVLGAITSERTVIGNQLQCAVGIFPDGAVLNQPIELLILLQNAIDSPLDVSIKVHVPLKDKDGNGLKFDLPSSTFQKNLEPLEVGVVHLPIYGQEPTPPGQSYPVIVELNFLPIQDAHIVRPASGGRPPGILSVSPFHLAVLRDVNFTANVRKSGQLTTLIHIVPGQFPLGSDVAQAKYDTLWTTRILEEEQHAVEEIKPQARQFTHSLTTPNVLIPIRNLTIEKFAAVNMPLHDGEATMIAKTLTYVLDDGLELEEGFSLDNSRWFNALCHLMVADPDIVSQREPMLDQLFSSIVYDAVLMGLRICHAYLKIDVGDVTERRSYAEEVRETFTGQRKMSLSYVYLPLVMAGITLNARMAVRDERIADNIVQIKEALQGRKALAGSGHNEIFDLTEKLIQWAEKSR